MFFIPNYQLLFMVLIVSNVASRELSLITRKNLVNDKLLSSGSNPKQIFVDIETDLFSAISPLTFAGTLYPWKILSPAFAEAHLNALQSENKNRRSFSPHEAPVLSSSLEEVNFDLYQNSYDVNSYTRLNLDQPELSQTVFQVPLGEQIKILIHGFQSGPAQPFATETKNAYLRETNHSVIIVDWEDLSLPKNKLTFLYYPAVTANAMRVGEKVAALIEHLLQNNVIIDPSQVHIIGHSLGAHSAGIAGNLIYTRYGRKVGRITGLDAAFLIFIGRDEKLRLDKNDAKFVDAIHTSALGIYDPIGHVDFYPNGGRNQASCYNPQLYRGNARSELARSLEQIVQSCSHARAYHFFIKSIKRNSSFWACKCGNWRDYRKFCKNTCAHREIFGEYVSTTARGKHFLEMDP